tara:strand:- start:84 stop:311 length:228 start_codon:yes stop_codon:yes gene_type:complete
LKKLEQILCDVLRLKKNQLNDDLSMEKVENWDSLKHMDLITSMEDELKIKFSMDEIVIMKDIKTIKKIINKKIEK